MSTRQPFMPSRAPSRTEPALAPVAQPESVDNRFDFANAKDTNGNVQQDTRLPNNTDTPTAELPKTLPPTCITEGTTNKPLNLAGFGKRRNKPSEQNMFSAIISRSRKSWDGSTNSRAGDPPEGAPQAGARIVAPRPFSPFFTRSQDQAARVPRYSSPSFLRPGDPVNDLSSNQAHIPTSCGRKAENDGTGSPQVAAMLPPSYVPPSNTPVPRVSSRPSLEKIQEAAEEDDGATEIGNQGNHNLHVQPHVSNSPMMGQHPVQRLAKRTQRSENNAEDEYDYGSVVKRYRVHQVAHERDFEETAYVPIASPVYRHDSVEPSGSGANLPPLDRTGRIQPCQQPPNELPNENALRRLLGKDLNSYTEKHLESYNEAKKKWSECSMEEWQAGAEEISTKFSKLIDFVKEHMTEKLALYASLHASVANHRGVLSKREQQLKQAQENLVRGGGSVVGSSAPSTAGANAQHQ